MQDTALPGPAAGEDEDGPAQGRAPRVRGWKRLVASPRFQAWAARFPLTRRSVRREGEALMRLVSGFVESQVLVALVELQVLEHLGERPLSEDALAEAAGLPPERARVLLTAAAALGIVRLRRRRWRLTRRGAALIGVPGLTGMIRSATEDPVTGLLNVRAFYDGLARLRREGADFAVLLANVAGMSELNERYGHPMGTEALSALGHALRRSVKGRDLVARLGSDEVAIALVGADRDGAMAAASRLAELLAEEELHLPDGTRLEVHAYFGIATYPTDAEDEVELLRAADHAIVAAKRAGPDEVAFTPA